MKSVAFILTMPGTGGARRWSSEDSLHVVVRRLNDTTADKIASESPYQHAWPDGWCASIEARVVEARESAKLRRRSAGFCGYEWMIECILALGRIPLYGKVEAPATAGGAA